MRRIIATAVLAAAAALTAVTGAHAGSAHTLAAGAPSASPLGPGCCRG